MYYVNCKKDIQMSYFTMPFNKKLCRKLIKRCFLVKNELYEKTDQGELSTALLQYKNFVTLRTAI